MITFFSFIAMQMAAKAKKRYTFKSCKYTKIACFMAGHKTLWSTLAPGAETSSAFLAGYLHNSLIIHPRAYEHSGWSNEPLTSCWVSHFFLRLNGECILIRSAVLLFCRTDALKVMIFVFFFFSLKSGAGGAAITVAHMHVSSHRLNYEIHSIIQAVLY